MRSRIIVMTTMMMAMSKALGNYLKTRPDRDVSIVYVCFWKVMVSSHAVNFIICHPDEGSAHSLLAQNTF